MLKYMCDICDQQCRNKRHYKKHRLMRHNVKNDTTKLKVLDLFCGCGGLSKGLQDAGLDVIAGIDIWDKAVESYNKNFDHDGICADLTKMSPIKFKKLYNIKKGDIDIIVGGPPCQGFSIAGKRDKNDPRNSLFMEYYKYLKYYNPKGFIMENVIGILSMKTKDNEKMIDIIMHKLNKQYNTVICKLYASDFGVPQNRRRTIILGIRKDLNINPTEPPTILKKEERIAVSTILEPRKDVDKKYYLSERAIAGINRRKAKMKKKGYGFGAQYLKMDKPSYTISARYWKDGYDALVKYDKDVLRRLTIKEIKRIQSFPDDYILVGNRKEQIIQLGNAVACTFAYYLGKHMIKLLQ